MPATPTAFVPMHQAQLAKTLPANDSGWTTQQGLIVLNAEEGCGQIIGACELVWYFGLVSLPNTNNPTTQTPLDIIGQYARIQISTDGGSTWTSIWTGVVMKATTVPDGANTGTTNPPGGRQQIHCTGLPIILDMIMVNRGYVVGLDSWLATPLGDYTTYTPIFNALPTNGQYNNTFGERSHATTTLGAGGTAYYFDQVNRTDPWSAGDIIAYLFAGVASPQVPPNFTPIGPTWTLSDPLGLLTYQPDKVDFDGKSLLECINNLINARRGCTWQWTVNGSTITINVLSTSSVALSAGSVTMPASTTTVALDTTQNPFLTDLIIEQDSSSQFDIIEVHGNHPLIGMTLTYRSLYSGTALGSLDKGWDATKESTWDPNINQGPAYQGIWRRFIIGSSWVQAQWYPLSPINEGLRNQLNYTTSSSSSANISSYGVGGYDGTRQFTRTTNVPCAPPQTLVLEKFIPLPYMDYSTTPMLSSIDMGNALLAPMLFIYDPNGGTSTTYQDITDDFTIDVESNPPAVVISGKQDDLADFLDGDRQLLLTIGVREPDPMIVSWQNADVHGTNYVSETPRIMVRRVPYAEQWIALTGTVMGCVNQSGTAYMLANDLMTVDDTPKLQSWLAYLKSWYAQPNVTATWADHSQIDIATGNNTFQPGAVVTTVNRGDKLISCGAVITSRRWDFTDANFGTIYTTERVIPDIDSIESHPRTQWIVKSRAEQLGGLGDA